MTPVECVDLVEFIADRCPAMKVRDRTADSWYIDLVHYDFTDAIEAARQASLGHDFVSLARLTDYCDQVRDARIGRDRANERHAKIAAENEGDPDHNPVTEGGPAFPLAIETGPLHARLDVYQQARREAAEARREHEAAERKAADAKAERASRRAEILAELEPLRDDAAKASR